MLRKRLVLLWVLSGASATAQPLLPLAHTAQRTATVPTVVTDVRTSDRSGVTYVYLQHVVEGVPVLGEAETVALDAGGRVLHRAGRFREDLFPPTASSSAALPEAAVRAALRAAGTASSEPLQRRARGDRHTFTSPGLRSAAVAERAWQIEPDGRLRLVWQVDVWPEDAAGLSRVLIDAETNTPLALESLAHSCFGAASPESAPSKARPSAYPPPEVTSSTATPVLRVFPTPVESPDHASSPPPEDARHTLADFGDPAHSPDGWFDLSIPVRWRTEGPNVRAYLHRAGERAPVQGPSGDFSPPLDLSQPPAANGEAGTVNAFYWANLAHDLFAHYGFTPSAGNFDGDDPVVIEVQKPGHLGATFSTHPDGDVGVLTLGLWGETDPARDSALDSGVIVHEYAHGLAGRLVGGPSRIGCVTNGETMAEGWSDWYALMLTMRPEHTRSTPRGIGSYVSGKPLGESIRLAPYTTDIAANAYTYADTRDMTSPHELGLVWATILWELTWDLIDAHGFDPDLTHASGGAGNQIALSLVTEALKLHPCRGGFVDGRNAILAADALLYQAAHTDLLWRAFARRGLGWQSQQGDAEFNSDNEASFEQAPSTPRLILNRDVLQVQIADRSAQASLEITNGGGRMLELQLASVSAPWLVPVSEETRISVPPGTTRSFSLGIVPKGLTMGLNEATATLESNDPTRSTETLRILAYSTAGASYPIASSKAWRLLGAPFSGVTPEALETIAPLEGVPWNRPASPPDLFELTADGFSPIQARTRTFEPGEPFLWHVGVEEGPPASLRPAFGTPLLQAPPSSTPVRGSPVGLISPITLAPIGLDGLADRLVGGPGVTAQIWNPVARTFEVAGTRSTVLHPWQVAAIEINGTASLRTSTPVVPARWPSVIELEIRRTSSTAPETPGTLGEPTSTLLDRALVVGLGVDADAPKLRPFDVPYLIGAFVIPEADRPLRAAVNHDPADGPGTFDIAVLGRLPATSSTTQMPVTVRLGPNARIPDTLAVYLRDLETGNMARLDHGWALSGFSITARRPDGSAPLVPAFLEGSAPPRLRLYVQSAALPPPCWDADCEPETPPEARLGPVGPNPATSSASLEVVSPSPGRLSILDARGRIVYSRTLDRPTAPGHRIQLPLSPLAAGVYVVRLVTEEEVRTRRFVIAR